MLRAGEGDEDAFAQLVEAYQDRLIGIFYHMLGDHGTAEDLVQDVFLRVYRARDRYEPTAKFSTWLYRIANNAASNIRRSKGRRKEVTFHANDSGPMESRPQERLLAEKSALMPTRQLASNEVRTVVQGALGTLSERQRMALLLHRFEGMSYDDIGATMGLSLPAVKSLLSRARESLRIKLEPYVE